MDNLELGIVTLGHQALLKPCDLVYKFKTDDLYSIIFNMKKAMEKYNGVGLAAPQIDIKKRIIMFYRSNDDVDYSVDPIVLINPIIKSIGNHKTIDIEACLSVPGLQGSVQRYTRISWSGFTPEGIMLTGKASDFEARVMQHEVDHTNGITYIERIKDIRTLKFTDCATNLRF